MNPLLIGPAVEIIKEMFKFKTKTMRKEAITLGITPAVVMVYTSMSEACSDSCTFTEAMFAPSGVEWAALIMGVIALLTHLNQKRKETIKQAV